MKRLIPFILFLLVTNAILCQSTNVQSFECRIKSGYQGFTQSEIITFISQSHFENFRLLDKRVTLSFDNGFDIILLSAKELEQSGLLRDVTAYQSDFPPNYILPVFHLNDRGQIAAGYPANKNVKYSRSGK
jgi:hypothetical protein